MTITQKANLWPVSHRDGSRIAITSEPKKIAASQSTYIAGALFYESTSGTLKVSDTSDGTGDLYQYRALELQATELDANTEIMVARISAQHIYGIMVENNTADAAATAALKGNEYGLTISTTSGMKGYVTLDVNNSNPAFHVTAIHPEWYPLDPNYGSTTDTPGIVYGYFLPSVIDATRS
jgi:hypothetical protein